MANDGVTDCQSGEVEDQLNDEWLLLASPCVPLNITKLIIILSEVVTHQQQF